MGVWLIASPWLLGFPHTRAMHLSIGFGIVIVLLALLDLFLHYEKRHPEDMPAKSGRETAHQ
ncbi:SPW repeat protein [Bradyrhizobium commune]|uniref:SPW repeat protein n=1 Tax=Bradyrhizobium commune TaxID=83627 RepID=UPI001FEF63A7|nr:SPW repeat protein [Bradyrhizobium commune]